MFQLCDERGAQEIIDIMKTGGSAGIDADSAGEVDMPKESPDYFSARVGHNLGKGCGAAPFSEIFLFPGCANKILVRAAGTCGSK